MPFFIRDKKAKLGKRKRSDGKHNAELKRTKKPSQLDEDVSSESDEEENRKKKEVAKYESSDNDYETAQEKKIRLAKKYLEQIENEEKERHELEEIDKSVISRRLRDDVLEESGKLKKRIASNFSGADSSSIRALKNGHKLSVTCVVVSPDNKLIFSASKDASIIKWDFESGRKLKKICGGKKENREAHPGHSSCILALALSSDSKFLVSGGYDKKILVWNPESLELVHKFVGHRGPVSGLAFRRNSHQLFSASFDRSVKVWNLDEMVYVETLFGHQDQITAIDSFIKERAITAGGRDNSVRIWKVVEESQLVFQGNNSSIDCVKLIDEQHFVSAGDDGSMSLWSVLKKKPLVTLPAVHGQGTSHFNWITSLAVVKNTDLIASGSQDGQIRFWKSSDDFKKLEPIFNVQISGFVNSMHFTSDGQFLIVAVGQEHKLGRWWRLKEAKNCIFIIPLNKNI